MARMTLQNRQAAPVLDRAPVESAHAADRCRSARMHLYPPAGVRCQDCWIHGRDAAILAYQRGGLEAARVAEPAAREYQHDRAVWEMGRAAFVDYMSRDDTDGP